MRSHLPISKRTLGSVFAAGAAAALAAAAFSIGAPVQAQPPRLLAPPLAADGTLSFADLVERVSPAVVSVLVEREVEHPQIPSELERFFQFRFGAPDFGDGFGDTPQRMEAQGAGFFVDDEGHVVTNNHVVEDADRVKIRFADGRELDADVVGTDPMTDLAVLKVEADPKQAYVQFADDVNLRVGDWVVAIGNPFGLGGTVTSGIVSAIGGRNRAGTYLDYIQIDAPINRGNSGGPTFDLKGRVVGVNTAIYSPNGGNVGIGFAIPSKIAKNTVQQLIRNGSVTRGWLGVQIQPVTTEIAAALGRKEAKGALVNEVMDGTPAAKAGFRTGDLVIALNGDGVEDPRDLTRRIGALSPGAKARVKILREGSEKVINVTLGQRDEEQAVADASNGSNGDDDSLADDLGVRVTGLNEALRRQFRVPDDVEGVMVTGVKPGSAAQTAGLRPGVVILQVEGQSVKSARELKNKIDEARKQGKEAVLMRLQFGENKQFGALPLKAG
ncbi:MAG: Do family serine endopeptidase [Parvularculaceae bacterium]